MTAVYVFGGILAILLIAAVAAPILERQQPELPLEDLAPAARRDAALEALRELEFEFQTGKLVQEDYLEARQVYARAALEARDRLEAVASGADLYCAVCGEPAAEGAKFCTGCGGALSTGTDGQAVGGGDG